MRHVQIAGGARLTQAGPAARAAPSVRGLGDRPGAVHALAGIGRHLGEAPHKLARSPVEPTGGC